MGCVRVGRCRAFGFLLTFRRSFPRYHPPPMFGKIPSYYSALFVSSPADGHMKFVIFPVLYLCRERIRLINRLLQFQHFHQHRGLQFLQTDRCSQIQTIVERRLFRTENATASLAGCHTTASPSGSLPNAGSSIPSDVVVSSRGHPSSSSVSVVVSIKHGRPRRS